MKDYSKARKYLIFYRNDIDKFMKDIYDLEPVDWSEYDRKLVLRCNHWINLGKVKEYGNY
jgi:hypothetical protein